MSDKVVSPGVFSNEIDASFLPATIGDIGAVIVGPTVKGPVLTPTVVSSYSEFVSKFGNSFKSGSSYYQYLTSHTVENYLRNASTATICRIAGGGYSGASVEISSSIDGNFIGEGLSQNTAGDNEFTSSAAKASASFTITFDGNDNWFAVKRAGRSNDYSVFHITGGLQADLPTDTSNMIGIGSSSTSWALATQAGVGETGYHYYITTGSNPSQSIVDYINHSGSTHGVTGLSASLLGGNAGATNVINSFTLQAAQFGPVDVLVDGSEKIHGARLSGSYAISTGSAAVVTLPTGIKSFRGGADFNCKRSGSTSGSTGTTGTGNHGGQYQIPFKLHTLSDGAILNNAAGGEGTNGILVDGNMNNIRYEINGVDKDTGNFNLVIRSGADTTKRKQVLETWNNVSLDPNSRNYIARVVGDQYNTINQSDASDPFIQPTGLYPNKSKYVRVEVLKQLVDYTDENGDVREGAASASLPGMVTGSMPSSGSTGGGFSGGSNGTEITEPFGFYESISNTNNQGLNMANAPTKTNYNVALNLLANADEYDFNLMIIPGIIDNFSHHTSIVTKAIDVCEERGDAFLLVDPVEHGTTNVASVTTRGKARDTNYAAMYWPWVQVRDRQVGSFRWVPPSVIMAGIYSNNDKIGHPWFAPAGLNRGLVSTAIQAERKLTHGNRDDLYASNINPLATFTTPAIPQGQGVCVWGQKTLQKKNSALDRVNVRRLMIKVKKFISASSRFLVFEQNTVQTRNRFLNIANPFLEQVQAQSGVSAFKVIMDDTNNTPDLVDRNILYGQIFIQPTRTAEFIILDFTVQPTGATFPGE